jgi:hypothetical protein
MLTGMTSHPPKWRYYDALIHTLELGGFAERWTSVGLPVAVSFAYTIPPFFHLYRPLPTHSGITFTLSNHLDNDLGDRRCIGGMG